MLEDRELRGSELEERWIPPRQFLHSAARRKAKIPSNRDIQGIPKDSEVDRPILA